MQGISEKPSTADQTSQLQQRGGDTGAPSPAEDNVIKSGPAVRSAADLLRRSPERSQPIRRPPRTSRSFDSALPPGPVLYPSSHRFYEGAISARWTSGRGSLQLNGSVTRRHADAVRNTVTRWAKGEAIEQDDDKWRVTRAALFVEDAWRRQRSVMPKLDTQRQRLMFVWHQRLRKPKKLTILALLVMTVFETPQWCLASTAHKCTWPTYPTFFINVEDRLFMSQRLDVALTVSLVLLLVGEAVLYKMLLAERYWQKPYSRVMRHWLYDSVLALMALDAVLMVAWPRRPFRVDGILRCFLYCLNEPPTLRVLWLLVVRVIPRVVDVWLLLGGYLIFTGVMGFVAFQYVGDQTYFSSVGESMWNLLLLTTTVNFPDIMVEQYNQSRWTFLFFFCFVTVGVFFLVPLFLAMVFNVYAASQQELPRILEEERKYRLQKAFNELDVDHKGTIPLSAVTALLGEIHMCRMVSFSKATQLRLQKAAADAAHGDGMVDAINGNGDKSEAPVNLELFMELMSLLDKRLSKLPPASEVEAYLPCLWNSKRYQALHRFVTDETVTITIPALLWRPAVCKALPAYDFVEMFLALGTLVLLPFSLAMCPSNKGSLPCGVDIAQVVLLLLYFLDTLLKLIVHGTAAFWRHIQYRFELIVSVASTAIAIYSISAPYVDTAKALHLVLVIRMLHMLVSLKWMTRLSQLLSVTWQIMARSTPLLSALVMWWYFMTCLGIMLFGGLVCDFNIEPEDPNQACQASEAARTTGYALGDYFGLNFNDFGSGMVTVFTLSVVNNWMVLTEEFVVLSGTKLARLFFVTNYYIGVACLLQVLNTFIITHLWKEYASDHNGYIRESDKLRDRSESIDSTGYGSRRSSFLEAARESGDRGGEGEGQRRPSVAVPAQLSVQMFAQPSWAPHHRPDPEDDSERRDRHTSLQAMPENGYRHRRPQTPQGTPRQQQQQQQRHWGSSAQGTVAELEQLDTEAAAAARRARDLRDAMTQQLRHSQQLADVAIQNLLQRRRFNGEADAVDHSSATRAGHRRFSADPAPPAVLANMKRHASLYL